MNIASTVNAEKFNPFGMSLYRISLKLSNARVIKHISTETDYEEVKSLEGAQLNLWRTRLWLAISRRNHLD